MEDTLWWSATDADLFFVSNAILVFTTTLYAVYTQDWRNRWRYLLYAVGAVLGVYLIAGVVNFFVAFNLAYVAVALVVIAVGTLFYLALREYLLRYLLMAIFAIGSLGFFYSVNYVFNDILQPHQQVPYPRIALGIESDPQGGRGYNVDQSKIAIGSGGLTGKGFLKGTQTKLNYVPEQETDFIFCTVGEESGFVGSTALLIMYAVFILRIVALAERQVTRFGRVYGYCVASIFLFHLSSCGDGAGARPRHRYPPTLLQLRGLLAVGLHVPALHLPRHRLPSQAAHRPLRRACALHWMP